MPVYVAFLRGINVGGNNKVPMADLRSMLEGMGFKEPKTILQSGNAIFKGPKQENAALEKKLEAKVKKTFGISVDFMVRTPDQLRSAAKANPFPKMAKDDPGHLLVLFLKSTPTKASEKDLQDAIKGKEEVHVIGIEAFITFPDGIGTSKTTPTIIEKKLGTRATGRNWNTLTKIIELANEMENK